MSSGETAFENAMDDLIEALNDIGRKHMLSPFSFSLILHLVARAADRVMLDEMGSEDPEQQGGDQSERSINN
jgi:hypothetical protein